MWRWGGGAGVWAHATRRTNPAIVASVSAATAASRTRRFFNRRAWWRKMSLREAMNMVTSQPDAVLTSAQTPLPNFLTALEIVLVYGGILLYIWRWQLTYPRAWMVLFAIVLVSHVVRRDRLTPMGLTFRGLRACAQTVLPWALAFMVPAVIYGFLHRDLLIIPPGQRILKSFATYGIWCVFQQYLMQSYFHHRLMSLTSNRHLTSALVALMFGAAHIPNPILMIATTLGGFLLAEVFARHRNIFPLALAQTVGGFLIAALSPASLIHNMRVGPGYFFFGLR